MVRRLAAVAVLGAAVLLPHGARAQSAMCAEQAVELGFAHPAEAQELPSPLRDEELPWCASAEDPRCAPLHGDSASVHMALRQPLSAGAVTLVRRPDAGETPKLTPDTGLPPSAGAGHRVERPPRAIR